MTSLLEIGPGSSPLISAGLRGSDWLEYENGGEYTAVQPEDYRGTSSYKFPLELLKLPRVRFIDAAIEEANLPDNSFDEVIASNVLSDTGAHVIHILDHAARVTKTNGIISFLDFVTPEYGPAPEELDTFYEGICKRIAFVKLAPTTNDESDWSTTMTDEWVRLVGPYHIHTRELGTDGTQFIGSTFIQFQKLPA